MAVAVLLLWLSFLAVRHPYGEVPLGRWTATMIGVLCPLVAGMAFRGRRSAVFWLLLALGLFLASNLLWLIDYVCCSYVLVYDDGPRSWRSVLGAYEVCELITGVAGFWLCGYLLLRELPRLYLQRKRALEVATPP